MFTSYPKLWGLSDGGIVRLSIAAIILFFGSVVLPVSIALGTYDPSYLERTATALALLSAFVLFYNVRAFATWIFPLVFIAVDHRVQFAATLLLAASFLADRAARGLADISIPFPICIAFLLAAAMNGYAISQNQVGARFYFYNSLIIPIALFVLYYNLRLSYNAIWRFLFVLSVLIALIGVMSLLMYFMTGVNRIIWRWGSVNSAACIFGMVFPFTVVAWLDAERWESKLGISLLMLGSLGAVVVTQTRAVLLSTVIGIFYIALTDKRVLKPILPGLLAAGIAAPGLIAYRLVMLFGHGFIPDWSSVGRIQVWTNSAKLIPKYFLTGMGISSFPEIYAASFPNSFITAEHAHNILLRWLFDYGIVGMVSYAMIVFFTLKTGIGLAYQFRESSSRRLRLLLAVNAGLISGVLANMVDSTFSNQFAACLLWIFLAFALTLARDLRNSEAMVGDKP